MADDLSDELQRNIPLSEMIQTLRQELKVSMKESQGDSLRFEVKEVELELQVSVSRDKEAKGGLKFWVIEASGGGKCSDQSVHRFKLKLVPKGMDGAEVKVADED